MRKQTHDGIAGNIGGVYHGGGFATGDLPRTGHYRKRCCLQRQG